MRRIKRNHRNFSLVMALIILISSLTIMEPAEVSAASKYIKVDAFIKYIIQEIKVPVDNTSKQPYIDVATKLGILKDGDFKNYGSYLTRTDCAVIANRLDEYINLKYNCTNDVYELLSGCEYYDGRLYYNVKRKLYPVGAKLENYPAAQFYEEVVSKVLETTFKYDNWANRGLRCGYYDTYDSEGNTIERYIEIGVKPESTNNIVGSDPFNDNSYIIQAWNKIKDGDRKYTVVLEKRISDINKISKSKREAVAAIVAKGIIKGYSNGLYIQNRSFRGSEKITVAGAKDVIQKVLHPEKRALISPDGQLIRTTNLPKNAGDYPYILECFPNEYYEVRYNFMFIEDFKTGKLDKNVYAYPKETDFNFLYNKFYKNEMTLGMDRYEIYDKTISQVEKYLRCVFNMDYKTVNNEWREKLASTYARYRDERIYRWLDDYISAVKKNNVVIESKIISLDPGTMYSSSSHLYVRAYVQYRIKADNINVNQDELIYGTYNDLQGLKNNEWRYGYYDIEINSNYNHEVSDHDYWGVWIFNNISDWEFKSAY